MHNNRTGHVDTAAAVLNGEQVQQQQRDQLGSFAHLDLPLATFALWAVVESHPLQCRVLNKYRGSVLPSRGALFGVASWYVFRSLYPRVSQAALF